jgi:D-alanyl-D-alanine carboxypeptidase/D-alanyl-D-alanine-endopeptidase (penicillin-binding protein 4)
VNGGYSDPVRQVPAADPAIETGNRLAALLAARRVQVAHGVRRMPASESAREITHVDSPPLATIVGDMLRGSDNYTAEEVLRALAGTTTRGVEIALGTLHELGVPTAGAAVHDGSGLAPDDRLSCSTLLAVLELSSEPRFAAIDRGLAVAGRSGTLATRFVGDPLAGRLRAKTGSIDNVVGLVGVIDGRAPVRFAFLASGSFTTSGGQQLQADIAHIIAAPGPAPSADRLVPLP